MTISEWKLIANKSKLDIRKETIRQFFDEEQWRDYTRKNQWPIYKDVYYLRQNGEYGEFEKIHNTIMYFEYKAPTANPPIQPIENHFYCRHCREEKPIIESRGRTPTGNITNICTPCSKKYRSENYSDIENRKGIEKYHRNAEYRLGCVIKTHIHRVIKGKFNKVRDKKWEEIVGLSKKEFISYITSMLQYGWNMDNYGTEWVIHHIIPRDWSFVSGREFTLNEILSSATVLPVEENWEDVELYPPDNENQFEKTISLKNGVIIKPKGL
jgi:hypothetical protein